MSIDGKVNILLVDDHEEGLLSLEAVLRRPNYNLVKASSGNEALSAVLKYDFAVILMDVQMPGMDGFETVSLIKQRERSKDIPIIFVTAINKEEEFVHRGYQSGAVDYIFKPFDAFILDLKVAAFVELYLKNRQLREQAELIRQSEVRDRARQITTLQLDGLKRYRHLADSIPHIIWKFQSDGTLDYCNRVWTDYSGLTLEQSSGSGWQLAIFPEDLSHILEKFSSDALGATNFEAECRLLRNEDNSYRWHILRGVLDPYVTGESGSWVVTCTDIDDMKNIEKDLIRAKEESLAANQAKSNFLANMSHEIRTPLGVVLGFSELLAAPEISSADRDLYLATIQKNGELLSRLIGDVLDLSKIEAGHIQIERAPFSLPDFLFNSIQSFQHQAEEKGIRLSATLETSIPTVINSDPMRLRQIMMNVVGNAIKFTEKGEVKIQVKATKNAQGQGLLQIAVTDEGLGITEEQAAKLFKPFIQADSSTTRKYGGTGLGLALSRKLANKLGGDVVLSESALNKGSTFIITLDTGSLNDIKFVDRVGTLHREDTPVPRLVGDLLSGVKVLLAEDSPDNQTLISHFLSLAGAKVQLADNGQQAVDLALDGNFDIVLMDIQMPVLDGYQATRQLRSLNYVKPILALTAHALKEERERSLAAGCDDHLTKPVHREQLLQRIAQHCRRAPTEMREMN
ncbi:MAG: response regulator [Bdellovibrionales bacterium]|nr:response regulator [Bdellovibrionales bacterium]